MQNIIINDKPHDYHEDFKLVMTTRLPNPLFTPELFAKSLVIDMTVTMQGLEQQLLGQVIGKEKRELEEERAKLVEEVNANEKRLKEFEDRLLAQLAASKGNLIDDEDLIATLAEGVGGDQGEAGSRCGDAEADQHGGRGVPPRRSEREYLVFPHRRDVPRQQHVPDIAPTVPRSLPQVD